MSKEESLFFELLQVALGTRERLSRMPEVVEWRSVYEIAQKQSLLGLTARGLEKLAAVIIVEEDLLAQWLLRARRIKRRNGVMNQHCVDLLDRLKKNGLRGTVLKGQGIAQLYDKELRELRQAGDIDVFTDSGLKGALMFARSQGQKQLEWDYKHLHLSLWEDVEIELHYHVEFMFNLWKNARLQKWFKTHESDLFVHSGVLISPTVEMDVFYILLHIYRHFFEEGIGLRQMVDYYYVLRQYKNSRQDGEYALEAVRGFGMERFARGVMWVLNKVCGMGREYMPWTPDEREGSFILAQIMEGGNFGKYSKTRQRKAGHVGYMLALIRHNTHLVFRYPCESLSAPLWMIWHWFWRRTRRVR